MLAVAPGCELDVQRGPGWLLVRVGSLDGDFTESCSLAEQLWAVLERHFTYRLVLELDEVPVLNSCLLGQLVLLRRRIEKHGGTVRLCGLSAYNRRVLKTSRLDSLFCPYRDRHEAVMGWSRPQRPR
jgi:anti-anti-sigma factor